MAAIDADKVRALFSFESRTIIMKTSPYSYCARLFDASAARCISFCTEIPLDDAAVLLFNSLIPCSLLAAQRAPGDYNIEGSERRHTHERAKEMRQDMMPSFYLSDMRLKAVAPATT